MCVLCVEILGWAHIAVSYIHEVVCEQAFKYVTGGPLSPA